LLLATLVLTALNLYMWPSIARDAQIHPYQDGASMASMSLLFMDAVPARALGPGGDRRIQALAMASIPGIGGLVR
jgi:hypothetical protein